MRRLSVEKNRGKTTRGKKKSEQDNQSVINLSINPVNHKRSKHYRVAMAYIRDLVERRITELHYCPSEDMVADVLTKALPEAQHWKLLKLARFGKFEWF